MHTPYIRSFRVVKRTLRLPQEEVKKFPDKWKPSLKHWGDREPSPFVSSQSYKITRNLPANLESLNSPLQQLSIAKRFFSNGHWGGEAFAREYLILNFKHPEHDRYKR